MHFDYYMEKLVKTDYGNQKNLRFFVDQYKRAQEMIQETEAFYKSFLISKTNTILDVLNNERIKWIEINTELNKNIIYECANYNDQRLCAETLEDFLDQYKVKYDNYRKNGDFDGAHITIYSPLVKAVNSQINYIRHQYEELIKKLTVYAISCGKHPYQIKKYIEDDPYHEILPMYLMPKLHGQSDIENKIKPIFKGLENFAIFYDYIDITEEYKTHQVYRISFDDIIGHEKAFMSKEDRKYLENNYFGKKSNEIKNNAKIEQIKCFAWLLKKERSESDIKKNYPLMYDYYIDKYNQKLNDINKFKKKYNFLFDSNVFERFTKLQEKCITKVMLKDFLKDDVEYTPFQGFSYNVSSVGWYEGSNSYENYKSIKIEDGSLETWLKMIKKSNMPENARPGSWGNTEIPKNLTSFKTSDKPKNQFSDYCDYDDKYSNSICSESTRREINGEWLVKAVDKKKLYKYVEDSWKELIDMCKHIIISSADKNGNLIYSIPIKSAQFNYTLSNIYSRVIISNDASTVYYVGYNENDLNYNIKYDEKKDQIICSRTDVEEHKKYAWPSDAPIIRTTYNLKIIFNCSNGNLIQINGSSDSDEISCKRY